MIALPRYCSGLAFVTAGLLIAMFVISAITGVNQQYFESVHAHADYEAAMLNGEGSLRILLVIDALFIAAYWLLGIFLVRALWSDDRKFLLALSVACISVTAVLDVIENSEFLMFMESLGNAMKIPEGEIQSLAVMSAVKWHLAYFAFLFLGFAFPQTTSLERAASFMMKFIQFPVGILVFVIPASPALVLAHLFRLVVLLVLLAMLALAASKWQRNVTYSS